MKTHIVQIERRSLDNDPTGTAPATLTPDTHPLVFLMALLSHPEDLTTHTFSDESMETVNISKNHLAAYYFIRDFWESNQEDCITFLTSVFKVMNENQIDLYTIGGASLLHKKVGTSEPTIHPDQVIDEEANIIAGDIRTVSVSHDYFRRGIGLICSRIPVLSTKLRDVIDKKNMFYSFIPDYYYDSSQQASI